MKTRRIFLSLIALASLPLTGFAAETQNQVKLCVENGAVDIIAWGHDYTSDKNLFQRLYARDKQCYDVPKHHRVTIGWETGGPISYCDKVEVKDKLNVYLYKQGVHYFCRWLP